jgi:hypothetical protein
LIAGSPSTHDPVPLGQAIDVQHYAQNASLWGGGMSMDGCMDHQTPPFQQLVSASVSRCAQSVSHTNANRRHVARGKSSKINSRATARLEWASTEGRRRLGIRSVAHLAQARLTRLAGSKGRTRRCDMTCDTCTLADARIRRQRAIGARRNRPERLPRPRQQLRTTAISRLFGGRRPRLVLAADEPQRPFVAVVQRVTRPPLIFIVHTHAVSSLRIFHKVSLLRFYRRGTTRGWHRFRYAPCLRGRRSMPWSTSPRSIGGH